MGNLYILAVQLEPRWIRIAWENITEYDIVIFHDTTLDVSCISNLITLYARVHGVCLKIPVGLFV